MAFPAVGESQAQFHVGQQNLISRYLDTVGDESGDDDMIGDYSLGGLGPVFFKYTSPEGEVSYLEHMIVHIRDAGVMNVGDYGSIAGGLTNGMLFQVRTPGDVVVSTERLVARSNGDWSQFAHEMTPLTEGSGDNVVNVRWTFVGSPVVINPGWSIGLLAQDDLSGLVKHTAYVSGYRLAVSG